MTGHQNAGLSAMLSGGFYNKNSALQAAGISMVLPVWQEACRSIVFSGETIVIADYGCSQGRNSLIPMRIAIDAVRSRASPDRPIQILHTDLPVNDFSILFRVLEQDPDSYMLHASRIFPVAIGRSYFDQIVPEDSIHLIWNTWTLQWMSEIPMGAPDALTPRSSKDPAVVACAEALQDADWRRFLALRGRELRPGGKLLTCFVAFEDGKGSGWEDLLDDIWESVVDLERGSDLSKKDLLKITLPVSPRTRKQIDAPFDAAGRFGPLTRKRFDMLFVKDPLWPNYEATGDARKLAEARSDGVRAWAAPAIKSLLDPKHDRDALIERIFSRFTDRLTQTPRKLEVYLASLLLEKDA